MGGLPLALRPRPQTWNTRPGIAESAAEHGRTFIVDREENMNHQDRINGVIAAMEAEGLDIIVGVSNSDHHIEKSDAVAMLSGCRPLDEGAVVLERAGKSTLVATPSWDLERAQSNSRTSETMATDDLPGTLAEVIGRTKVPASRIGVGGLETMSRVKERQIIDAIGGTPKPASKLLTYSSRRKTADEIEHARKAAWIAERGHEMLLDIAKVGIAEDWMASELNGYMKSLGADDNFYMMTSSDHNPAVMQPKGHRFVEGDIIVGEMTPSYEGQFAQICRTVVVGPASELLEEKYELLVRAMTKGIEAAAPGKKMGDITSAIDEVLTEGGYGEYCAPPYMNRRGHGLGISCTLPGNVSYDNEMPLEEDMFFVIHPNQYIPETGYLMCGEPTLITAEGSETLSQTKARLYSVAA